ncbi:hypothetical protein, partial [Stenotrophomonas sp. Ste60]|uniref:hypothetical protein n=1 Tax=Stenotrophomonas sp. Ste60 TaxID=2926026 RepID=UPI0021191C43
ADLLHAMQALSQLSYGPTMLEAEFYADVKRAPSLFSATAKKKARESVVQSHARQPEQCRRGSPRMHPNKRGSSPNGGERPVATAAAD